GFTDASCGQNQVDIREAILDALHLVFDTARMEQHRSFRWSPDFRGTDDADRWNTGNLFGNRRCVSFHQIAHAIEIDGVFGDELFVDPASFNQDVKYSIGQSAV